MSSISQFIEQIGARPEKDAPGLFAFNDDPNLVGVHKIKYNAVYTRQGIDLEYCRDLKSFSAPRLKSVLDFGYIYFGDCSAITALSFPKLTYGVPQFVGCDSLADITDAMFPVLSEASANGGNLRFSNNAALVDISGLNQLVSVGAQIQIQNNTALVDISGFSSLEEVGTIAIGACSSLATISGFTSLARLGGHFLAEGCALTEASVNAILSKLVACTDIDGTTPYGSGKTINLSSGTNAAPTGQGVIDAATLTARGATVTTN